MARTQSPDPMDRMGVYKRLGQVPENRRLERYQGRYKETDTYETFLTEYMFERYDTDRTKEKYRLAGRRWKSFVEARGRHHALARPTDVDEWMASLLEQVTLNTAYNTYWVKLERFYWWLQRHPDHPHSYHPVLMAAVNLPHAGRIWETKVSRRETK